MFLWFLVVLLLLWLVGNTAPIYWSRVQNLLKCVHEDYTTATCKRQPLWWLGLVLFPTVPAILVCYLVRKLPLALFQRIVGVMSHLSQLPPFIGMVIQDLRFYISNDVGACRRHGMLWSLGKVSWWLRFERLYWMGCIYMYRDGGACGLVLQTEK